MFQADGTGSAKAWGVKWACCSRGREGRACLSLAKGARGKVEGDERERENGGRPDPAGLWEP